MQDESFNRIDRAVQGDKKALEELLGGVQDLVFNLSLRMLGNLQDAEDASQEIHIRIITGLASFRKKSAFSTWVYRIAANHLLNYKKSLFARQPPLSFEFYGADIEQGFIENIPALTLGVEEEILTEELKLSCTNVMLQCFDPESRLIYVLGIMFRADSSVCGEILGISAQAYRQRLSRIRKTMADFLAQYCGLVSPEKCGCRNRIGYAVEHRRLNPMEPVYTKLEKTGESFISEYIGAMEEMDVQSAVFAELPHYRPPQRIRDFIQNLLMSDSMAIIQS